MQGVRFGNWKGISWARIIKGILFKMPQCVCSFFFFFFFFKYNSSFWPWAIFLKWRFQIQTAMKILPQISRLDHARSATTYMIVSATGIRIGTLLYNHYREIEDAATSSSRESNPRPSDPSDDLWLHLRSIFWPRCSGMSSALVQ